MNENEKFAILSGEVAEGYLPMLYGERSDPLEKDDSGWQFTSGQADLLDHNKAQVWSIAEVLTLDDGLKELINRPVGTRIFKATKNAAWTVVVSSD